MPADTSEVVISPGLSLDLPIVVKARRRGITVVGDIELFARVVDRPVAAITGSNGKTATKEMVAAALSACWTVHATAGNNNNLIGVPLTILTAPLGTDCPVVIASQPFGRW